ncbi:hypothetical protein ACFWHR_11430 [Leucobacter sp. NPDC058333]|uniref:hypothetical protein n=1 Tax=Leucobacter sp. NPDC058333 TaxID=3346450 RepID=UPI00365AA0DF
MTRTTVHPFARLSAGAAVAAAILVLFTGCAPEPGSSGSDAGTDASVSAPADTKGANADSDSAADATGSWQQQGDPAESSKSHELPASFPSDAFVLPPDAPIDDAGERATGEWYLVLSVPNAEAAKTLWQSIIDSSGFTESDRSTTDDGGVSANLNSDALSVVALQIPQPDGSVLVSFDIATPSAAE